MRNWSWDMNTLQSVVKHEIDALHWIDKGFANYCIIFFFFFTQYPNFAGIRLLVPSRVGTLFLPYTAALEGERKRSCVSKSNLKWTCTISESALLLRDVDIYLRKSNLEAFTSCCFFYWNMSLQILTVKVNVSAINFQTLLSRSVARASVCEQRAPNESRVQAADPFQPHVLKHSIDQWLHLTPQDRTHFHTSGSELRVVKVQTFCFQRRSLSLAAQVLDLSSPSAPSHRNPKWKKCVSPVFTTSQWPFFFHCPGSPIWVCPLHHGCLFPITAEITTIFMTHRRCSRHINSWHIAAKRSSFFPLWLQ